jgi:ElaB/YqjD/DUF883 family membrane-anchored ribosome-binding protein
MARRSELEVVRDDLAQLREDLAKLMTKVGRLSGEAASDTGARMVERAQDVAHDLTDTALKSYDRLADEAKQYATTVERQIAEHPFGAAAIALAAGLVISRLLERDRSARRH